jgi:ComF family protein
MVYQSLISIHDFLLGTRCELCHLPTPANRAICPECERSLTRPAIGCRICATALHRNPGNIHSEDSRLLCGQCQQHPPAFESVTAAFSYVEPVSQLIVKLKYHRQLYLARILGSLLADYIEQRVDALPDIVLPIPLHRSRMRSRGFNQAYEIAKPVAKRLALPIDPWTLVRSRNTPTQTDLPRKARAKNVRGAFSTAGSVEALDVALVDDVMTTGHTASAAAEVLLKAGANRVDVWLLARA